MPDEPTAAGGDLKSPTGPPEGEKVVLEAADLRRSLVRIAHEVIERNPDAQLAVVGIHRRGVPLAQRLAVQIGELTGEAPATGEIDISFYRDDIGRRGATAAQPVVHSSRLEFETDSRVVVLVDDVLFTGRTVRAAIDALFDYGRPHAVQLAVIADRGHRELPIRPDFVGKNLPTAGSERVNVFVEEFDGFDAVTIVAAEGGQ